MLPSEEESPSQELLNSQTAVSHETTSATPLQSGYTKQEFGPSNLKEQEDKRPKGLLRRFTTFMSALSTPPKPVGDAPGFMQGLKAILFASWLNLLLVCIPISWALHFASATKDNDVLIFIFSFLAIIPLAKLLAVATDELSIRVGQTLAGLLNATLGNAVELIVAIIAIFKCELQVTQSSLIGSILSNLLLVLGMCFFVGGMRYEEQGFGASASQINSSLLTISVIAVLMPAAFHLSVQPDASDPTDDPLTNGAEGEDIKKLSHGVAIILLFIYAGYLVFQLWSHASLYNDKHKETFQSRKYSYSESGPRQQLIRLKDMAHFHRHSHVPENSAGVVSNGVSDHNGVIIENSKEGEAHERQVADGPHSDQSVLTRRTTGILTTDDPNAMEAGSMGSEEEAEEEKPSMSVAMTIGLLIVVTVLVAVTAEWLVDSINGVTEAGDISKEWVGLILLPIVGNAAEHVTAVTVAYKDKLDLSIGVAVGSSIQIALFVIPLMTVIAWIAGKPLLLLFDPFESVTLFLTVLAVNYTLADARSNWLEGMILMCIYLIIAVSFWFYPGSDIASVLAQCT